MDCLFEFETRNPEGGHKIRVDEALGSKSEKERPMRWVV
jgi:hypothetical protein